MNIDSTNRWQILFSKFNLLKLPPALKQAAYYGLGLALMKSVSLIMLPFIVQYLSPQAFGQLEVLTSIAAFASIVVGFGLTETLFRFAANDHDEKHTEKIVANLFGSALLLGSIAFLIGMLALEVWQVGQNLFSKYDLTLIVITVSLESLISIPLAYLRFRQHAFAFFIISVSKAFLQAGCVYWFLIQGKGLTGVLEAGAIAGFAQAIVLMVWQFRATGMKLSWQILKPMVPYAWPLVISALIAFMLSGLDRWIIAGAVDFASLAQYAIAFKFGLAAALLLQPFGMWWFPQRFRVIQQDDGRHIAALRAGQGSMISMGIAVVLSIVAPILILGLFPANYHQAIVYVPWMIVIMMIKDNAELLNLGCYIQKNNYYPLAINCIGSFSGLAFMLVGVLYWEVMGVIYALLAAQSIRLLLYLWKSQQLYHLPYNYKKLLLVLPASLSLIFLSSLYYKSMLL